MATKTATKTKEKLKVLLVDDNEIIRMYVRDIFWLHGLEYKFDFIAVDNIVEASKIINDPASKPAIILLDLSMPAVPGKKSTASEETGFSLLREIKGTPSTKDIKVAIFSGFTEKKYRDKSKELGADYYLVKDDHLPQDMVKFIEEVAENV